MAVMLSKISTLASLLIICAAIPSQPLYNSKQAVSSQSFIRHDVPLSYKYTAVHEYATDKKDYRNDVPKIQYAPLYSPEELKIRNDLNTKVYHESNTPNQNREIRKDHLEPKEISGTAKTHGYVSYIPGHNIELLQSVNRSPGLNTDYRSDPETTSEVSSKTNDRINYHRAFPLFNKPQREMRPSPHPPEGFVSKPPPYDDNNKYKRIGTYNANSYQTPFFHNPSLELQLHKSQQRLQDIHELTKQIEAQRISSHPKMNTLLLNLARVYNAYAPLNSHINYLDTKTNKIPNTQAVVKGPAIKITSDHVNRLIPIRVANPQLSRHGR